MKMEIEKKTIFVRGNKLDDDTALCLGVNDILAFLLENPKSKIRKRYFRHFEKIKWSNKNERRWLNE